MLINIENIIIKIPINKVIELINKEFDDVKKALNNKWQYILLVWLDT